MKCLFLFMSLLGCTSISTLQAEVLESNVTLTYRLHAGHLSEARGKLQVQSYSTVSFKTSDVIHQISLKIRKDFSPKAKLIHKTVTYSNGPSESFYIVRDPVLGDFDATAYFEFVIDHMSRKSKLKVDGTGTSASDGAATFNVRFLDIREGLYGIGPVTVKTRYIASRQYPGTLIEPATSSHVTYGHYKLNAPGGITTFYATGTIKLSPPKITQTPTEF